LTNWQGSVKENSMVAFLETTTNNVLEEGTPS
jgi:hypothetical protein